jgi:hypothetical protein
MHAFMSDRSTRDGAVVLRNNILNWDAETLNRANRVELHRRDTPESASQQGCKSAQLPKGGKTSQYLIVAI